ncbi:MAG: winged helix-turn-helix transcriptional regulator [Halolamina sp.]
MSDGIDEDKRATLRRFAAVSASTPLAVGTAAADDPAGDSDVREAILGYLATTPGAHFSKLRDDLRLGTGETQHHLRRLLEAEAVEAREDGEYRRFFPVGRFSSFEQVALGYLRRSTPRGMALELLADPTATGADLAAALEVSRSTVSKHAARLAEAGLLNREGGYTLCEPELTLRLLVQYADSFGPEAVAFAAEADEYVSYDP